MSEDSFVHLTIGEQCWFFVGILTGVILTLVGLLIIEFLPSLSYVQQTQIVCFVGGMSLMFAISKIK